MTKIYHVILTKFNTPVSNKRNKAGKSINPLDKNWLMKRKELFDQYCFPSIKNQINKNFYWLVFFHPETSPEFYEEYRQLPNFRPVIDCDWRKAILEDYKQEDIVISSRVDNDDALAVNYVEEVQKIAIEMHEKQVDYMALNFNNGLTVFHQSQKVQSLRINSNPFMSFIHRATVKPIYVWDKQHPDWKKTKFYRGINTAPMYLQVIHDDNILNNTKSKSKTDITDEIRQRFGLPLNMDHTIKFTR